MTPARIMIVEDESLVATDLEDRLTRLGYTISAVTDNGEDALRLAREDQPDLALMDIRIIGAMDGTEVADLLQKEFGLPVVFLTSHADPHTLHRAGQSEPFGYVLKPFEEQDLHATIEMAFARFRAETRLRQMERWLATTLRSIGDAVIATDVNGRITFINPVAESLTGWTLHEALGRRFGDVFHPFKGLDRRPLTDIAGRAMREGITINLDDEVILLARGGRETPIDDSAAPIRDDEDNITGAIVIFRDRSQQLRQAEERRRLEGKMREAQKLESLGLMASGIAHDFNNLLTAVLGNTHLLEEQVAANPSASESVRQIGVASRRAADLCRQMLAYTGKAAQVRVSFDLGKLASDTAALLRISISKKADLQLTLAPNLPPVCGDPGQIQQIVMNLVINASDALSERSGQIILSTGIRPVTPEMLASASITAPDCRDGNFVFVEVADTGHGMSRETLGKIFDPFFTTKFIGRGLGLASVAGIVRGHRGALTVASQPGEGSRFCLLLPATAEPVNDSAATPVLPADWRNWKGTGLILLVDDEDAVRLPIRRMLERAGYTILEAANGRDAVKQCALARGELRLVVMDLTMPDTDSDDLLVSLRSLQAKLPVLLISGYSETVASDLLNKHADAAFIQKPFLPDQFFRKACALVG